MASKKFKNGVTCTIIVQGPRKRVECTNGHIGEWTFTASDDVLFQEYANGAGTEPEGGGGGDANTDEPQPDLTATVPTDQDSVAAGDKENDSESAPQAQNREIFVEHPKSRSTRMATGRLPNRVTSPFFDLQTDPLNPVNAEFNKYLTETNNGIVKGETTLVDPRTNAKYPKGFTPPIDFYQDQTYRLHYKTGTGELESDTNSPPLNQEDTGLQNTNNPDVPADQGDYAVSRQFQQPLPGRHKEYGVSLTYYGDGAIKIFGAGKKTSQEFFAGGINSDGAVANPIVKLVDGGDNLRQKNRYVKPTIVDPNSGESVEYGVSILDKKNRPKRTGTEPVGLLSGDRYGVYDRFDAYGAKNFLHGLDYFIDQYGLKSKERIKALNYFTGLGRNGPHVLNENGSIDFSKPSPFQNVYLGEYFLGTLIDNEDPTILGVDIRLKYGTSPLLITGEGSAIENFINGFGSNYTEIISRYDLLQRFREQLYKFIQTDEPSFGGEWLETDYGRKNAKIHYLQSVSGLDRLIEQPVGSDPKQFIDYGKDMLTLEFLEDVGQNMGYLASLYKMLTWSRISGKQIIPPNLLKFDLEVRITEMRNYKRNIYNNKEKSIISFTDQISRYNYTLYECEFVFDKMPHGEMVKNTSGTEVLETFKLPLTYKFSTLEFKKFDGLITVDGEKKQASVKFFIINNVNKNILKNSDGDVEILPIDRYIEPDKPQPTQDEVNSAGTEPESNDLATNTIPEGTNTTPGEETEPTLDELEAADAESSQDDASQSAASQTEYIEQDGFFIPETGVFISNKTPDPIFEAMRSNTFSEGEQRPILNIRKALMVRTLLNIREQSPGFPGKIQGAMKPDAQQQSAFQPPSRQSMIDNIQNSITNQSTKPSDSPQGQEKSFFQNPLVQELKRGLKNAVVNQINRVIVDRARLLNNAIDDIRNKIPFAGRMSEPTNVYTSTNAFRNDIINALRNFAGGAIKSFFKKPI